MTRKEMFIREYFDGDDSQFKPHWYCVTMRSNPDDPHYMPSFPAEEPRCVMYARDSSKHCYGSCEECWNQPIEQTQKEKPMKRNYVTELVPKPTVHGLDPDVPVVQNANGGKQSSTPYGFHLLPTSSIFAAAEVAAYGANKYGEDFHNRNYTKISVEDHINHCIQHLYGYLAGDTSDDHLGHAIVRAMFAYDVASKLPRKDADSSPIPGQIHMREIAEDNW